MGKGEIARYEQFLLFPQCFQKACFPGVSKGVIVWEWVNYLEDVDFCGGGGEMGESREKATFDLPRSSRQDNVSKYKR